MQLGSLVAGNAALVRSALIHFTRQFKGVAGLVLGSVVPFADSDIHWLSSAGIAQLGEH